MSRSTVLRSRRARTVAAFAGVASAALATTAALALPASAAANVTLIGQGGNQGALCSPAETHNVNTWIWPVEDLNNGCGSRVWLHGDTGWTYCVSPGHDVLVPSAYRDPINFQITSNKSAC